MRNNITIIIILVAISMSNVIFSFCYSYPDIMVYLLHTTSFATYEEVN